MNPLASRPGPESAVKSILAIVVLYKVPADRSQSFRTVRELLQADPRRDAQIDLIVCDNTPYEQPRPQGFEGLYVSDTSNPGLAKCYNLALKLAGERGASWLLLLDQDTTPTAEYIDEVLAESAARLNDPGIVALVPRLIQDGVVQSPHLAPTFRHPRLDSELTGKMTDALYAFNSASVIRVSALQAIGGFPEDFWLDFLDHATFHQLQQTGARLFLLKAALQHELSANSIAKKDSAGRQRYQNILDAEHTFYQRYGSLSDRFYHRVRLMRGALGQLIKRGRPGESFQMLRAALRLSVRKRPVS